MIFIHFLFQYREVINSDHRLKMLLDVSCKINLIILIVNHCDVSECRFRGIENSIS
jgi:hypothetical protein